jgi:FKBP-type peptidyl-prolyl cis-trans isomerase
MKRNALSFLTVGLLVSAMTAPAQITNHPATPPPNFTPAPPPAAPAAPPAPKTDFSKIFKDDKEKISYAIGMSWGAGLKARMKKEDVDIDMDTFAKGFKDNLGNGPSLITEAQEKEILTEFGAEMRAKQDAKRKQAAEENRIKGEKNKADGDAFLAKNKTAQGVVTLPDGLQYKIITEGQGESPKAEDEVTVNYRGKLIDGTEFDSSFKRNEPLTTRVQGGIIKGWTEALQLMKPGAKWELYIPSDLAYGPPGRPPLIGPESTLIFEIELLSSKHSSTPLTPGPAAHAANTPLTSDIIKVPSAEEMKKGAKIETIKAEDLDKAKTNQ